MSSPSPAPIDVIAGAFGASTWMTNLPLARATFVPLESTCCTQTYSTRPSLDWSHVSFAAEAIADPDTALSCMEVATATESTCAVFTTGFAVGASAGQNPALVPVATGAVSDDRIW